MRARMPILSENRLIDATSESKKALPERLGKIMQEKNYFAMNRLLLVALTVVFLRGDFFAFTV